MSRNPLNQTFQQQQKRLVRATFKKGFISAIYVNSMTVDVSFAENPLTVMRNIPVAGNVNMATLIVGQRCKVDIFDETNPKDCVMAFGY